MSDQNYSTPMQDGDKFAFLRNTMINVFNIGIVGFKEGRFDDAYVDEQVTDESEKRVTRDLLSRIFSQFGEVKYIDYKMGTSEAYIRFAPQSDSVEKAIDYLASNKIVLGGEEVSLKKLSEREEIDIFQDGQKRRNEHRLSKDGPQGRDFKGEGRQYGNEQENWHSNEGQYQPRPYQPRYNSYPPRDQPSRPPYSNNPSNNNSYQYPEEEHPRPAYQPREQYRRPYNNYPEENYDNQYEQRGNDRPYQPRQPYQDRPYRQPYQEREPYYERDESEQRPPQDRPENANNTTGIPAPAEPDEKPVERHYQ